MRLEAKSGPHPRHGGLGEARLVGHRAATPVGGPFGGTLQRLLDQLGNPLLLDAARPAGAHLVVETLQPPLRKPAPPLAGRRAVATEAAGDLGVTVAGGCLPHNPGAHHQRMRRAARAGECFQLLSLSLVQDNGASHISGGHRISFLSLRWPPVWHNECFVSSYLGDRTLVFRGHPIGYQPLQASREARDASVENPKHLGIL